MTDARWQTLKADIRGSIGENNYKTWIDPVGLSHIEDGVAVMTTRTAFAGTYVSQNFGDAILTTLNRMDPTIRRLTFRVANAVHRPAEAASAATPASPVATSSGSEDAGETMASAPLDARFTFDTFVVGKPNALAHAAARRVAEGGPATFNPLFLYGGVGLGKTHLMHAISWELRARRPDMNILYLSAEQFMYRFVQALRDRKMMDFKELFRAVDVLMVDDVQFIAGKDSTQEEFFHTFNALVEQNKQIIISADRAPDEIKDMENRIRSRLQCGLVVDLHPTDYELRLG
ncbi:MAG: chromosomal replication initiator protein DnaA, partial [Primorskyibacter sp.]